MHRFFLAPDQFNDHQVVVTDSQFVHQWFRVLRFRVGDRVVLCDGNQNEYFCVFEELDQKRAVLNIERKEVRAEKLPCDVHLYIPILNNQNRFEIALEKGTEFGVKSFTPILTRRTQVKSLRKFERLQNIIREACEQSGRTILPQLNPVSAFEPALKSVPSEERILFGFVGEADKLFDMKTKRQSVFHVFIGPEGDFDASELTLLKEKGAIPFSLGKQILRAETAVVAATVLLLCR